MACCSRRRPGGRWTCEAGACAGLRTSWASRRSTKATPRRGSHGWCWRRTGRGTSGERVRSEAGQTSCLEERIQRGSRMSSSTLVGQERTDAQFPPNLILQDFIPPLLRHLSVIELRISTMLPLGLVMLLASSSLGTQAVRGASSTFSEDLALRPLPDGKVDAFFTFSINSTARVAGASCESLYGMPDICVESEPDLGHILLHPFLPPLSPRHACAVLPLVAPPQPPSRLVRTRSDCRNVAT